MSRRFHGSDSVPSVTRAAGGGRRKRRFRSSTQGVRRDESAPNLGPGSRYDLPGSSMARPQAIGPGGAHSISPAPSPMQCAPFRAGREWVVGSSPPASPRDIEPLMGWTSGQDPFAAVTQLRFFFFRDLQSAIEFCRAPRGGTIWSANRPVRRFQSPRAMPTIFRYGPCLPPLTRAPKGPGTAECRLSVPAGANTGPAGSPGPVRDAAPTTPSASLSFIADPALLTNASTLMLMGHDQSIWPARSTGFREAFGAGHGDDAAGEGALPG